MADEKYSILAKVVEQQLKEQEDEKYLQSLAKEYTVGKNKNYDLARSIVLNIQLTVEYYIDAIIATLLVYGGKDFDLKVDGEEAIERIGKIGFSKKFEIIKGLSIFSDSSIETMGQLNILRNAFAHGRNEDISGYKYKENSIFQRRTIDLLITDHKKHVTKEAIDFITKPDK